MARRLLLGCALASALGGAGACGRAPRARDWTATVAARHAEVDQLLDRGDRSAARQLLASIVNEASPARPPGEQPAPAGGPDVRRVLLQDTYFRLARLALDESQPAAAAVEADRGLALGDHGDLFAANLLVARGAARAAMGDAGRAMQDYHRALAINEDLLGRALHRP